MNVIKKYIKPVLIGLFVLGIIILLYSKDQESLTGVKLPGYKIINKDGSSVAPSIGQQIRLVSVSPPSNSVIDTIYLKFEFSDNISVNDFSVDITPNIALGKEVKISMPNTLWISPRTIWEENVKYKMVIKHKLLSEDIVYYTSFKPAEPQPIIGGGPMMKNRDQ